MSEVKQYRFSAIIHQSPGLDASYIEFPYDVFTEFGTRAQVKVAVEYDGIPYRTSLANMGTGCHLFVLPKEIRKKLGKTFGDTVSIVLQKDEAPRSIDIPSDLLKVLERDEQLLELFNKLSYTHRKEYVLSVTEAKKPETRERRIMKVTEMLTEKLNKKK